VGHEAGHQYRWPQSSHASSNTAAAAAAAGAGIAGVSGQGDGLQAAAAAAVDAGVLQETRWQWPQSNTAGSSSSSAVGASNSQQHSAQQSTDAATWQPEAQSSEQLHDSGAMLSHFGSLALTEPQPAAAAAAIVATVTAADDLWQQIEQMQLVAADAASSTALQLPLAAASTAGATATAVGLADGSFMQFVCAPPELGAAHAASSSYNEGPPAAASVASPNNNATAANFPALQSSSTTAAQRISSAAAAAPSSSSSSAYSFTASREVTHAVVATTTTTRDTLTMHAVPAAGGSSSSSSSSAVANSAFASVTQHTTSSSSIAQLEPQERVGVLGEAFAFSLLQRKLPGFDESCWHSSARQYWLCSEFPLQPPLKDPSYDFLYKDVDGELSGTPGTLCLIECKATSDDAAAGGSGVSTRDLSAATNGSWRGWSNFSQCSSSRPCTLWCVDRVGQAGGPRLVAVLRDPVGMQQEGQLWLTGQELLLCDFPVCS
jgi:hypothetical protein